MTSQQPTEVTVVVVGSGFGALAAAIQLQRRGLQDFVLLERRSFLGGTWLQNRYPGAAVDVPSPLYSLARESYDWSQMFAAREELVDYTEQVIARHRLAEKAVRDCTVLAADWDGTAWLVRTTRGTWRARFLISATGPLATPVVPAVPGRESFGGAQFHTNDWDTSLDLGGLRVAVVGSGASAVQVVPAIASQVGELHVFQRTPHWVLPRHDRIFTARQRWFMRRRWGRALVRGAIYWQLESRIIGFKYAPALLRLAQLPATRHLRRQVPDADLRAALTPDFRLGCKRVLLSSTWYPALQQPHVRLHDRADAITEVDATGVRTAAGEHVELDLIVWSTGYDATDGVVSYPVTGREGRRLAEAWTPYPRAYLGSTVPGFPNFFLLHGPNTVTGHTSAIVVLEAQVDYVLAAIDQVLQAEADTVEVTAAAEAEYTEGVHAGLEGTVWATGGCHSWYASKSGKLTGLLPGFTFLFRRLTRRFRPEHHEVR